MYKFKTKLIFLFGIFLGGALAFILKFIFTTNCERNPYDVWFNQRSSRLNLSLDQIRYGKSIHTLESKFLFKEITILCVIIVTQNKNLKAANATWAKGCNGIYPIFLQNTHSFLPIKRTKQNSKWFQLCAAIKIVPNNYHWMLFVYDTTFVLTENLRFLVATKNFTEPHYLGHAVSFWSVNYNIGNAGYVLSQNSVMRVKMLLKKTCASDNSFLNQEDLFLGKTLARIGIYPADTRHNGQLTFHSYNWQQEIFPVVNYYKKSIYTGVCCSTRSITFQAIEADKMYTYYYLLYQLQVFKSGHLGSAVFPIKASDKLLWKQFAKELMDNIPGNITDFNITNITSEVYYKLWESVVQDPATFGQKFRPDS